MSKKIDQKSKPKKEIQKKEKFIITPNFINPKDTYSINIKINNKHLRKDLIKNINQILNAKK